MWLNHENMLKFGGFTECNSNLQKTLLGMV